MQFGLVNNPSASELFCGGVETPATKNGQPIGLHPGLALTDGLTFMGCSARTRVEQIVPVLDRLITAGGMYVRNGSGALGLCDVVCERLLGYVEPTSTPGTVSGRSGSCRPPGHRSATSSAATGC